MGVTFALVTLAVIGFAYLLVAPLVHETRQFVHDVPRLQQELAHGHGRLGFLEQRFHLVEKARTAIESRPASATAGPVLGLVSSAARTGGAIVFVAFLALFVQLGGRQWFESLVGLVPEQARGRVRRCGSGISAAIGGYVTGNLLISVIAGSVATFVLLLTGVPYAVPLGIVVAVFDLVPLVGATIATVIVAAVALTTHGVVTTAIVVAAMILYQQIENNSLQQLVYHHTVNLSPLAIAVSVAVGAEVGGILGALLAIPFAGALKVFSVEARGWRRGEDCAFYIGRSASFPQGVRARSDAAGAHRTDHDLRRFGCRPAANCNERSRHDFER